FVARRYRPADPMRLATIRILYPNMIAEAGPCGLWPHDIGPSLDGADFQNREYWNFGCANQRNLAAMVENPADLVQPRGDTPAYAARRSTMLEKYRKGEEPSGKYATDKDGKISDLTK
ncbi:MAG: pilus assembly protein CpaD, partial [Alphaproteobacteria bacterium]